MERHKIGFKNKYKYVRWPISLYSIVEGPKHMQILADEIKTAGNSGNNCFTFAQSER